MLKTISVSGLLLLASLGIATAQQKANDPGQQAPANPQGDGAFKSQQGGKEEPGSHPPVRRQALRSLSTASSRCRVRRRTARRCRPRSRSAMRVSI